MWLLKQPVKPRFLWLIEWDAFFSGDIAAFFKHYRNSSADLITTPVFLFTKEGSGKEGFGGAANPRPRLRVIAVGSAGESLLLYGCPRAS